jgi:hypothetical protein
VYQIKLKMKKIKLKINNLRGNLFSLQSYKDRRTTKENKIRFYQDNYIFLSGSLSAHQLALFFWNQKRFLFIFLLGPLIQYYFIIHSINVNSLPIYIIFYNMSRLHLFGILLLFFVQLVSPQANLVRDQPPPPPSGQNRALPPPPPQQRLNPASAIRNNRPPPPTPPQDLQ